MKKLFVLLFLLSLSSAFAQSDRKLIGLLKKKYNKEHRYVLKRYTKRKRFYVGKRSRRRYLKLSRVYSRIAKRLLRRGKRRKNRRILKQAQMFARLASYVRPRDNKSYKVARKIKKVQRKARASDYKKSYFAFFSYHTWQDELKFDRSSDGASFNMLNTAQAMGIGVGMNYENAKYNWFLDLSYAIFAKGQGGVDASSIIDYKPKREIQALTGGPGVMFKSLSEDLDIGLQALVLMRKGDWNSGAAKANGFNTEDDTLITGGLVFVSSWDLEYLKFTIKYGRLFGAKSSFFALNTVYEFEL